MCSSPKDAFGNAHCIMFILCANSLFVFLPFVLCERNIIAYKTLAVICFNYSIYITGILQYSRFTRKTINQNMIHVLKLLNMENSCIFYQNTPMLHFMPLLHIFLLTSGYYIPQWLLDVIQISIAHRPKWYSFLQIMLPVSNFNAWCKQLW